MKLLLTNKKLEFYLYTILPEFILEDTLYREDLDIEDIKRAIKTNISLMKNSLEEEIDSTELINIYEAINNSEFSLQLADGTVVDFSHQNHDNKNPLQALGEKITRIKKELDEALEELEEKNKILLEEMEDTLQKLTEASNTWKSTLSNLKSNLLTSNDPIEILTEVEKVSTFIDYTKEALR